MERFGNKRLQEALGSLEIADRKKFKKEESGSRIKELQRRVCELQSVKERLQSQLLVSGDSCVAERIHNSVGLGLGQWSNPNPVPKDSGGSRDALASPYNEAVKEIKCRKLQAFLQAYRLGGLSVVEFKPGHLIVELQTSFGGRYYEAYYVHISDNGDHKDIVHGVPSFIEVNRPFQQYLASRVHFHGFLLPIFCQLKSFASRREQLAQLKRNHGKLLDDCVVATAAYDHIQLTTKLIEMVDRQSSFFLVLKLLYQLDGQQPYKVHCKLQATGNQHFINVEMIKKLFMAQCMTAAFRSMLEQVVEDSSISVTSISSHSDSSHSDSNHSCGEKNIYT